ncbi:MAG: hypothetical protein P8P29_04410 [Flavobacteriaceae bacterium]|nr:hypothetical protein [Flavobacteriaceae bacterium]
MSNINPSNCGCLSGTIQIGSGTPAQSPCPSTECGEDCLVVASPVVPPLEGVGPCGKTATLDLTAFNTYTACTGSIVHKLLEYDTTAFTSVSISSTGELVYVTSSVAQANSYYDIAYKVVCTTSAIGGFGIVRVGIKDVCNVIVCSEGQNCDPCTETCVNKTANMSIQITSDPNGPIDSVDVSATANLNINVDSSN